MNRKFAESRSDDISVATGFNRAEAGGYGNIAALRLNKDAPLARSRDE
jgi:hypothetical protein